MKIIEQEYLNTQIEEGKKECTRLSMEHEHALNLMIRNNTQENRTNYRIVREKLIQKEFMTFFYMNAASMLKESKSEIQIANEFKVILNKEKELLNYYKKLYCDEHEFGVGTPLDNKKIEVSQLELFMKEEVYKFL